MIKTDDLRKLSNTELLDMKKELEFNLMKTYSLFGKEKVGANESGIIKKIGKSFTKKGTKTSTSKNIKRVIAKINTILNERRQKINN